MSSGHLSVHELRSRWKPIKQRLLSARQDHPTSIRLHRALSWLARCENDPGDEEADLELICLWVAFNALYGQWDPQRREPLPDRDCWRRFLDRLVKLDATGHLSILLVDQRDSVMTILDDEHLSSYYWENPSEIRASKSKKARFDARTWYVENKWAMILDRLVERIYLLRCQLVHGAATYGSKLNRTCLHRCVAMLRHLLISILLVLIDHGGECDWGEMCYPPLNNAQHLT